MMLNISLCTRACIIAVSSIVTSNCQAETALEVITRAGKNPLSKPAPNAPLLSQKEREAAIEKAKKLAALRGEITADTEAKPAGAVATQRVDEIIVEAQREPEDVVPAKKPAFQKMKEALDGVGKSVGPTVVETSSNGGTRTAVFKRDGKCYSIKNNAGRMNNDGSLGSAGRDAMTCSPIEAAAK